MRRLSVVLTLLFAITIGAEGLLAQQTGTVRGTVVDATSLRPLSGAQVFIPDTEIGVLTGQNGRFNLQNVPAGSHTLRTVLIGYGQVDRSITVSAGETLDLSIQLGQAAVALEGLVVTALQLERQARTLGVAAQQIDDDQLSSINANIVSGLSGQVAGVSITNSTTQGGSSRIVMRGENSLLGDNQPLFVLDGVPVNNYSNSTQGVVADQGGYDYGTLINDIDPESIQSMTVLKGANAAALYGSRAANGAILIETKRGIGAVDAADIVISQTMTWEDELRLPQYQNEYGQGNNGQFEYFDGDGAGLYDEYDESWGPPLDQGLMIPQFHSEVIGTDGSGNPILEPLPWTSSPDNIDKFYEIGNTFVTNVSVARATDRLNGRLGFTRFDQDGMVPGFQLERTSLTFAGSIQATDRLDLNTSFQYITHEGNNRPAQGYDGNNPQSQLGVWFGRQVDMDLLKANYTERFPEGHPAAGSRYNWQRHYWDNPYFLSLVNTNTDARDRIIGQVTASLEITDWLSGTVRTATDYYQDDRLKAWVEDNCCGLYTTNPLTAAREQIQETGAFGEWKLGFQETNTDFLLAANPDLNLDVPISTTLTFGGNRRDVERTHDYVWVGRLATPRVYNLSNAAVTPETFNRLYRERVNSLYGQVEVGYDNYAFLTFTGRNDWSSTLPEDNNSYFYPSVSGSFIFSDAFTPVQEADWLSYGKVRASWARVGNDTEPYRLRNTYVADEIWEGNPTFQVPNALLNEDLKPETTESYEAGVELGFFDDRLGLDLTWYQEETRDQIFNVNISPTTGYGSRWLNAGNVRNTGWEVLVNAIPYENQDLSWRTSFTWATNDSEVVELAEGISGLEISLGDFWGASIFAREGEPYGQIVGRAYQRSPDGRIITSGGFPVRTADNRVIGNFTPDWRAGWRNEVSYRGFTLSGLLDTKVGGDIFSVTKLWGTYTGVLEETAGKGRCVMSPPATYDGHYPACDEDTGIIFDGVERQISGSDTTYVENSTPVDGHNLGVYNNYLITEANVMDASYIKLRELSLSFDIPQAWADRVRLSGASVSIIGRNLGLWTPEENPHIDPEHITEANNVQGIEYGQIPPPRSFGFTITARP